jgi:glutamyl-Q tRNA(Asp) synthetase
MYKGRFAPSPTGPLHFGSLIAAVASYLEAQAQQGKWLLRMEDLDKPREMPGAADAILTALEAFGFEWDDSIVYQSQRLEAYAEALFTLQYKGLVYPCACSRKEIADSAMHGIDGLVYPGTCRNGLAAGKTARAWRIKVEDRTLSFNDAIQGVVSQNLSTDIGDFVLKRADGFYAYQLAVVVDDAEQGITYVLRGADLLDSTPRQIYLQQTLDYPQPNYAHVPVAANSLGEKLSKQTLAQALDTEKPGVALWDALDFLGQAPPAALQQANLQTLWDWAKTHWSLAKVPQQRSLSVNDH